MQQPPDFTLRQWRDDALDALAEMNADPEVRYMPATLSLGGVSARSIAARSFSTENGFASSWTPGRAFLSAWPAMPPDMITRGTRGKSRRTTSTNPSRSR